MIAPTGHRGRRRVPAAAGRTPLPDAPDLARLPTGTGGGRRRPGAGPLGRRQPAARACGCSCPGRVPSPAVQLIAVGPAPAVGDAADVVIVDAGALAAAGVPGVPNTVWVTGPGTRAGGRRGGVPA